MLTIDLSGRIALVTGSTGELGRVMVQTLSDCGADVVVHYHKNAAKAAELVGRIEGKGRRAIAVQADVADAASVDRLKVAVQESLGAPDIVVCNAVSPIAWKPVLEQPLADYLDQWRTCVAQTVLLAQAFAPAMVARGRGRIVAINTECAMQCFPGQSAYVSGKRGMDGVLRVLAKEIGPHGVTVNQVAPGWTVSDRDREAGTERNAGYEASVPLRRRNDDQDIANAVAFLASDQAGGITGVYFPVCGGNVMPAI
jgi:3-oxoacyl-[acyl-carrier protein] reductase